MRSKTIAEPAVLCKLVGIIVEVYYEVEVTVSSESAGRRFGNGTHCAPRSLEAVLDTNKRAVEVVFIFVFFVCF